MTFFRSSIIHLPILGIVSTLMSFGAQANVKPVDFHTNSSIGADIMKCTKGVISSSDDRWVYATSFCDASIVRFQNTGQGQLSYLGHTKNEDEDGDQLNGVSPSGLMLISPDDQNLYVYGTTKEGGKFRYALFVFEIDKNTGELTQQQILEDIKVGGNPIAKITPDGKHIYLAGGNDSIITIRRSGNGQLAKESNQDVYDYTSEIDKTQFSDMQLNSDGSVLYLTGRYTPLIWFNRDPETGVLMFAGQHDKSNSTPNLINQAGYLGIAPDDQHLYGYTSYSASSGANEFLSHFSLNNGAVTATNIVDPLPESHPDERLYCPHRPMISPNGRLLYYVDGCGGNIQIWGRAPETGELTFYSRTLENDTQWNYQNRFFAQVNNYQFGEKGAVLYGAVDSGLSVMDLSVNNSLDVSAISEAGLGETHSITYDVANTGASVANRNVIQVTAANLVINKATTTAARASCQVEDNIATCEIFALVPGAGERITIDVTMPSIEGTGQLSASVSQDQVDIELSDNTLDSAIAIVQEPTETPVETPAGNLQEDSPASKVDEETESSSGGGSVGFGLPLFISLMLLRARREKSNPCSDRN